MWAGFEDTTHEARISQKSEVASTGPPAAGELYTVFTCAFFFRVSICIPQHVYACTPSTIEFIPRHNAPELLRRSEKTKYIYSLGLGEMQDRIRTRWK